MTVAQLIERPGVHMEYFGMRTSNPGEYLLHIEGASGSAAHINPIVSNAIADQLPDWWVSNRGTRIEILHRGSNLFQDDETVAAGVNAALASLADDEPLIIANRH